MLIKDIGDRNRTELRLPGKYGVVYGEGGLRASVTLGSGSLGWSSISIVYIVYCLINCCLNCWGYSILAIVT